ncbi:Essential protein Yae1, N terminal [Kalmusia sp. IMI 367209]|nr:Essential protein Yae1, N terminal [Kalmusia sp. IMI 367209]
MLSPTLTPTYLPAGNAPPTPPHADPLDDIYGSAPTSPILSALPSARGPAEEILSDLPSRQRALDTDAYREGLSNSKGQYVQEGFDEGYALGAELGLLVGWVVGVLQGFATSIQNHDDDRFKEVQAILEGARRELAIEKVLGREWVDEEGIWKWDVRGKDGQEGDVTFKEVAVQHPVVAGWIGKVSGLAERWRVDLEAVEKSREGEADAEEMS